MRHDFPSGKFSLKVEEDTFKLRDYHAFLKDNQQAIKDFKQQQQQAFEHEREQWKSDDRTQSFDDVPDIDDAAKSYIPAANETVVKSPVTGSVWQLKVEADNEVEEGQLLMILESMKMEIQVKAPVTGKVGRLFAKNNGMVNKGQNLLVLVGNE